MTLHGRANVSGHASLDNISLIIVLAYLFFLKTLTSARPS